MKRMSKPASSLNEEALESEFNDMRQFLRQSMTEGTAAHEVERGLWKRMLAMGHVAFGSFLAGQGSGDLGDGVELPDGRKVHRLEGLRSRRFRTIFGSFELRRSVYAVREGQKHEFVPLDTRLQLPEGEFSYVLQDWDQSLAVESSFAQSDTTLYRILDFHQPVDSLERMSRKMAETVTEFRESKPVPPAKEEGKILVISADGKGIPMRRNSGEAPILSHRTKGQKKNKKRMATVGTVYTINPLMRHPHEVVESLFRDPRAEPPARPNDRPHPEHKQLWASLTHEKEGKEVNSMDVVFDWLSKQTEQRNPEDKKPKVAIMDGQTSLWDMRKKYCPQDDWVEILDLLHVTPRLWIAAHLFHKEGSNEASEFVKERLFRLLCGEVGYVIGGLRQIGTKMGLKGSKKRTLTRICKYLEKNRERLRYNEYLEAGYPIASGVIEGACRHVVKDRMERAGMRWTKPGAQAMLDLRTTHLNGDWDEFTRFRIKKQTALLHPYAKLVKTVEWPLAAAA